MRCLHLNDNTTAVRPGESGFDKLHKIRPLLDTVKRNSLTKYKLHRENSVDEAMFFYSKGRVASSSICRTSPQNGGTRCGLGQTQSMAIGVTLISTQELHTGGNTVWTRS